MQLICFSLADDLQEVELTTAKCNRNFHDSGDHDSDKKQISATVNHLGQDSCQGEKNNFFNNKVRRNFVVQYKCYLFKKKQVIQADHCFAKINLTQSNII